MSTGEKLIRAPQWQPLDGSASNAIPKWGVVAGSQTQKIQVPVVAFDGAGSTIQYACYTTRVPVDYAAGGNLKLLWWANSMSGTVKWQIQTAAVTPADADTALEHAWGTAATLTPSVDTGEARRLVETTITMNMDSAATGDLISFLISRDPANDTCTADAELVSAAFTYSADDQAGSPIGYIGEGKRTSDITSITSIQDVTDATVTFTASSDRRYKVSAIVRADATVSGDTVRFTIMVNGSAVQLIDCDVRTSGVTGNGSGYVVVTGLSGSIIAKLRVQLLVGTGTVAVAAAAGYPTSILVEDIGT